MPYPKKKATLAPMGLALSFMPVVVLETDPLLIYVTMSYGRRSVLINLATEDTLKKVTKSTRHSGISFLAIGPFTTIKICFLL